MEPVVGTVTVTFGDDDALADAAAEAAAAAALAAAAFCCLIDAGVGCRTVTGRPTAGARICSIRKFN